MQSDRDLKMARMLQQQFEAEFRTENPSIDLTYNDRKNKNLNKNTSNSLIDPSWELVDPTPNIHILFVQFNQRFFWNKLLAVAVSWSKRMTVCAGVCSYQGRAGLCSITLSEPLLKLRPRKDLIETLLHEMIHAFLFVTHNNKDRDGHGPEFHKHMNRINNEVGTNITVYHDFHDEVRLYQQHWWRCNGPCQKRPPYFGMVRRSINRVPGPNDRWWAEHQHNCNGNFIKVKEPEKQPKKNTEKLNSKNKTAPKSPTKKTSNLPDIRNYLPVIETSNNSKASGTENIQTLNDMKSEGSLGTKNKNGTVVLNPKSSKNNSNDPSVASVIPSTSNIKGFTNSQQSNTSKNNTEIFSGTGRKLSDSSITKHVNINDDNAVSAVRNHWASKFVSNDKKQIVSKRKSVNLETEPPKRVKVKEPKPKSKHISCPNCNKLYPNSEMNNHLASCLNADTSIRSEFSDDSFKMVECPVCKTLVEEDNLNEHLDDCLTNEENSEIVEKSNDKQETDKLKHCEICENDIPTDEYTLHIQECLTKCYDNNEDDLNIKTTNSESVFCLVCSKCILKSNLNLHLEDCMVSVFEKDICEDENENENNDKDDDDNSIDNNKEYNCPICMSTVNESNMNNHIDECLNMAALKNNLFD